MASKVFKFSVLIEFKQPFGRNKLNTLIFNYKSLKDAENAFKQHIESFDSERMIAIKFRDNRIPRITKIFNPRFR